MKEEKIKAYIYLIVIAVFMINFLVSTVILSRWIAFMWDSPDLEDTFVSAYEPLKADLDPAHPVGFIMDDSYYARKTDSFNELFLDINKTTHLHKIFNVKKFGQQHYFLTQYALAPVLVDWRPVHKITVGRFFTENKESVIFSSKEHKLVREYPENIFLFESKVKK